MTIVRAAITQTTWTGDKESMLDKHEQFARDAEGAGRAGHLLPGALLRPVLRHHRGQEVLRLRRAGRRPDRAALRGARQGARHGDDPADLRGGHQPGVYYNTAVVVDADGTILGKYRKHHIPHLDKFWEKFYFRPGNLGYPVFDTAVGKIGVYICYDRHFPEGWRELGLNGAHIVFNPNATKPGLSNRLWEVEGPAAAVANGYFVLQPTASAARTTSTASSPSTSTARARSIDPRGNFVGERGSGDRRGARSSATSTWTWCSEMRDDWQFYRDRRPDSYTVDREAVAGGAQHDHDPHHRRHRRHRHRPRARRRAHRRRDDRRRARSRARTLLGTDLAASVDTRHRRDRQVRHPRRHRRAHPHGAAVRRHRGHPTPSRPARAPPRGAARRSIIDFAVQTLRRSACRTASPPGTRRPRATARSTTASTRSSAASTTTRSQAMRDAARRGHHELQAVHGLPGRLLLRRRADPARPCRSPRDTGLLTMMHAENGPAIDVLAAAARRARARPTRTTTASPAPGRWRRRRRTARSCSPNLTGRPALRRARAARSRPSSSSRAARDKGQNVFGETCPQYLYLSLEEQLGASSDEWGAFEGAKWVCSTPLRSRAEGHQDPMWQALRTNDLQMVSTDHCPFCMKDQKELGLGDFRKIPNGIGSVEHRMDLHVPGRRHRRDHPRALGRAHLHHARAHVRPLRQEGRHPARAPTPTSSSTTRTGTPRSASTRRTT